MKANARMTYINTYIYIPYICGTCDPFATPINRSIQNARARTQMSIPKMMGRSSRTHTHSHAHSTNIHVVRAHARMRIYKFAKNTPHARIVHDNTHTPMYVPCVCACVSFCVCVVRTHAYPACSTTAGGGGGCECRTHDDGKVDFFQSSNIIVARRAVRMFVVHTHT